MSINLKKNEAALQAAFKDVLSNSSDTNWYVDMQYIVTQSLVISGGTMSR